MAPRPSLQLMEKIWVGGTLLLIGFLVYVSQIFIIWPWYGREFSLDLLKLLVPFNLLSGMLFWNYYLCVKTSPGSVPPGWQPPSDPSVPLELKARTAQHRFCKTCRIYKPPRAHHCRRCGQCVLKMDHHCPWVANCVGYYNQGHFIRFLLYVDLATSYHLAMMFKRIYDMTAWTSPEPSNFQLVLVIMNLATCVPVWLMVGVFSIYHVYCAAGNSTTIEGWEKDRVATMVRRGKIREVKYPYDLGLIANMKSVLGPNPLFWLWPQSARSDGLSYPVSKAADELSQFVWPPQDPDRYPARRLPYSSSASAFTYGNGDLNPALRRAPDSHLRERKSSGDAIESQSHSPPIPGPLPPQLSGRPTAEEGYSSGEEREREDKQWTTDDDASLRSSPEPYLSDFDDEEGYEMERGPRRDGQMRVRRGSEGFEIAPKGRWDAELDLPVHLDEGNDRHVT